MSEGRSIWSKIEKSFGSNLQKAFLENWRLIAGVTAAFFIIMGIAIVANQMGDNPINRAVEDQTEPYRRELAEEVDIERSQIEWTAFYIRNNLVSAIEVIGLGVAFGVFPIYALLMNALMLGYAGSTTTLSTVETLAMILPHGVFELTGYILALSCGVKLGLGGLRTIKNQDPKNLKKAGNGIAPLVPASIILIIIAGFIEGFLGTHQNCILNSTAIQAAMILASLASFTILFLWLSGKITRPDDL